MSQPSLSSSNVLVSKLRTKLTERKNDRLSAEQVNRLMWMLDTLDRHSDWPPDKICRWLGFIAGTLDDRQDIAASKDLIAQLPRPSKPLTHEQEEILASACIKAMMVLAFKSSDNESSRECASLVQACWFASSALAGSFWLGYLQSALIRKGLCDIESERTRTRPIFHAAYRACGWALPPSVEPSVVSEKTSLAV